MTVGPLLSLEDHYISNVCQQDDIAERLALHQFPGAIIEKIIEVGPKRIATMDESDVKLQIVSHIPVVISPKDCYDANNQLFEAVNTHKPRFAAFATLPMAEPANISAELERCVTELNFVGALIPNHCNAIHYDGPEYLPMWKTAEKLNVPIYLHPCPPSSQALPLFHGNYSEDVAFAIRTHSWEWHANCGLHFIKLYAAGVFENCPHLKLVLGHLGEMVPFMLGRIARKLALTKDAKSWKKSFSETWAQNVWVTTSGMFDLASFRLVLETTKIDRIMFSVDYPFESTVISREFMETVDKSGLLSGDDMARICYRNAEQLLNVRIGS